MCNMKLRIVQDCDLNCSPRDWDNVGTMVCWHNNYILGDEQPSEDPQEFLEDLPENTVILPLYLYDHSGISMSTGTSYPFNCPWDSGQVGFIYVTPEKMEKEQIDPKKAEEILRGEVDLYDLYLQGRVYGFIVEKEPETCSECEREHEPEFVDSCFGFYGEDWEKNGLADHIPDEVRDQLEDIEVEY